MIDMITGILILLVVLLLAWIWKIKSSNQNSILHIKGLQFENSHILEINNTLIDSNQKLIIKNEELTRKNLEIDSHLNYINRLHENLNEEFGRLKLQYEEQLLKISQIHEIEYDSKNSSQLLALSKVKLLEVSDELENLKKEKYEILSDLKVLSQKNEILTKQLEDQKLEFEKTNDRIQNEIKQLSERIFQENTQHLSNQNNEQLSKALTPLKEQIFQFNEKLQFQHNEQLRYTNTLNEKIKEMVQQTDYTSKIAENLANALKGDTKFQGDWGEMILENILQNAGLEENREYFIQSSYKNESNNQIRPDIIIQLPGERKVVIDSKVSLTAYEKFCSENNEELASKYLDDHIKSIKNHISLLSQKDYSQIPGSLDFVMLFIPIESAYLLALKKDQHLWNLAYQKKIILMSSTNLIAAIKLIADLWKREYQHKNSLKIAALAEKMHIKLTNFINHFDEIGLQIQKTQNQFINTQKILITGKGNLSTQLNQLKEMGIKSKNPIKNELYFIDTDPSEEVNDDTD